MEIPSREGYPFFKQEEVADVKDKWLDTLKDLELLLPERPGGNVRQLHRSRHVF